MITIPTTETGKPIKPLGVVWYEDQEAYTRMQEFCGDMATATYEEWAAAAEAALVAQEAGGQPRQRVSIKPVLFEAWCAANRGVPNAAARQRYVHDAIEAAFTGALKAHKAKKKANRRW